MDALKVWKVDDGIALTLRRLDEADTQSLIAFVKGLSVERRHRLDQERMRSIRTRHPIRKA